MRREYASEIAQQMKFGALSVAQEKKNKGQQYKSGEYGAAQVEDAD